MQSLCIAIFERAIALIDVKVENIYIVICTSMLIASKIENSKPLAYRKIISFTAYIIIIKIYSRSLSNMSYWIY